MNLKLVKKISKTRAKRDFDNVYDRLKKQQPYIKVIRSGNWVKFYINAEEKI